MLSITPTSTKEFMRVLLTTSIFDFFTMVECDISTFITTKIDGFQNKEYYVSNDSTDNFDSATSRNTPHSPYVLWADVKNTCLSLIKGKQTPLKFQFVLHFPEDLTIDLKQKQELTYMDMPALVLIIRFDGNKINCTTSVNHSSFTLDKTWDKVWDATLLSFFEDYNISYSID